jgi:hypothetical protein
MVALVCEIIKTFQAFYFVTSHQAHTFLVNLPAGGNKWRFYKF